MKDWENGDYTAAVSTTRTGTTQAAKWSTKMNTIQQELPNRNARTYHPGARRVTTIDHH
jgi:hypothetical protein